MNNYGWRLVQFHDVIKPPMVTTFHNANSNAFENKTYLDIPNGNYVSISYKQREILPNINYSANIYHGIDVR